VAALPPLAALVQFARTAVFRAPRLALAIVTAISKMAERVGFEPTDAI
jgi:hypothetical protein